MLNFKILFKNQTISIGNSHTDSVMAFQKFRLLFISLLLPLLTACNPFASDNNLDEIQTRGDIVMGTINSSLTYSYDGTVYSGFDYELGKHFADYLDVELQVKEFETLNELFTALDSNEVDFIGSALTLTPKRAKKYRSSPPYYYVSQKVVYHKGTYRPRKIDDINKPISVLKDSSHEETLANLADEAPNLTIKTLESEDQESLLRRVAAKEITFAIVDSSTLAQKQRYYPVLAEAFTISEKEPVAWLIKRDSDDSLYSAIVEFIGQKYQDQSISKLEEKYFGHVEHFDFVDTRIFLKRSKSKLPKYEALFKKYATSEVDWLLLASVSYQESHWKANAKSPTGVRGLMMLTRDTADYLGIRNRLNPEQSIKGGGIYLSQLIKRLPDSIPEDEKIWFALASYNIGYGHLMDARRITAKRKQNPDSWSDVKDNLPLLHQKRWYKNTRYGYARGREAQQYVNNIRQYRKTLTWFIDEREKKRAEKQAKLAAIAEKKARQNPLTEEEKIQRAKDKTAHQEKLLRFAQKKTLAKQELLLQVQDKIRVKERQVHTVRNEAISLQLAVQKAQDEVLAAQLALKEARKKIVKEEEGLQKVQDEVFSAQQAKDSALSEQAKAQKAKDDALGEQLKIQQAMNIPEKNEK